MGKADFNKPSFFISLARAARRRHNFAAVATAVFDARGKIRVVGDTIVPVFKDGATIPDEMVVVLPLGWGQRLLDSISPDKTKHKI